MAGPVAVPEDPLFEEVGPAEAAIRLRLAEVARLPSAAVARREEAEDGAPAAVGEAVEDEDQDRSLIN